MKKDSSILIKIDKATKKQFTETCDRLDTTPSKQIRKFIERYIRENHHQEDKHS